MSGTNNDASGNARQSKVYILTGAIVGLFGLVLTSYGLGLTFESQFTQSHAVNIFDILPVTGLITLLGLLFTIAGFRIVWNRSLG